MFQDEYRLITGDQKLTVVITFAIIIAVILIILIRHTRAEKGLPVSKNPPPPPPSRKPSREEYLAQLRQDITEAYKDEEMLAKDFRSFG